MKAMSRRRALTLAAGSIVVPFGAIGVRTLQAAEPLDPSAPAAEALGYVEASEVAEQNCANCQLYKPDGDTGWGACAIFPDNVVGAEAWCKAWVKRVV